MSSTRLFEAVDAQRALLAPPTKADIASVCKALAAHAEATGLKQPEAESLFAVWEAHCRDMPAVLLVEGLATVLKGWTNTYCLPSPGAVWEAITYRLARMRADLETLENARWNITAETPIDPDGERGFSDDVQRVLDETRAKLRAAGWGRRAA